MDKSILTEIKKMLGIPEDDTPFDVDIIININTAISTLTQLGVGPKAGFSVIDKSNTWEEFVGSEDYVRFIAIKTYIYLKVKQVFDPPTNSAAIEAISNNIKELEWRLNVNAEEKGV